MGRRAGCRVLKAAIAVAICAVAVFLSACGAGRMLNGAQLETEISEQLLPEYPGAIRSVACPETADPAPGESFLCVATMGSDVIDVLVTVGGTEDALTTSAVVDARFVAVNEVAALLAATFGDEIGLVTSVDCGQPVLVLAVDEPVVCRATDPSGITRAFDVTIGDDGIIDLTLR